MKTGIKLIHAELEKRMVQIDSLKSLSAYTEALLHLLMSGLLFDSQYLDKKDQIQHHFLSPLLDQDLLSTLYDRVMSYADVMEANYQSSSRAFKKSNHGYYHYQVLLGVLNLNLQKKSEASTAFQKAIDFSVNNAASETDGLQYPAKDLLEFTKNLTDDSDVSLPSKLPTMTFPKALNREGLTGLLETDASLSKHALSTFDTEKVGRYFIDPVLQLPAHIAPLYHWEKREPGSTRALQNAVSFMLETASQPIDIAWIKTLHQHVSQSVENLNGRGGYGQEYVNPGVFRTTTVMFGLNHFNNATPEGVESILAFIQKVNKYTTAYSYHQAGIDMPNHRVRSYTPKLAGTLIAEKPDEGVITTILNESLQEYRADIIQAKKETYPVRALIKACARFAHELCLTHAYRDCNLRHAQQLLNKLLLENDLPLTMLKEPSLLEGHSPDELVDEILQGMMYFKHFTQHDYFPTTAPGPNELVNVFDEHVSDDNYFALSREQRQFLIESEEKLRIYLQKGLLSAPLLLELNPELISVLNRVSIDEIKTAEDNCLIIDKIIRSNESDQLVAQLEDIFILLSKTPLTVDLLFSFSEKQRNIVLKDIYIIQTLFEKKHLSNYKDFFSLPPRFQIFITQDFYRYKSLKNDYNISFKELSRLPDSAYDALAEFSFLRSLAKLKEIDPLISLECAVNLISARSPIIDNTASAKLVMTHFELTIEELMDIEPKSLKHLMKTRAYTLERLLRKENLDALPSLTDDRDGRTLNIYSPSNIDNPSTYVKTSVKQSAMKKISQFIETFVIPSKQEDRTVRYNDYQAYDSFNY